MILLVNQTWLWKIISLIESKLIDKKIQVQAMGLHRQHCSCHVRVVSFQVNRFNTENKTVIGVLSSYVSLTRILPI